jgi:F-type H+-transporting ATPase subunit a
MDINPVELAGHVKDAECFLLPFGLEITLPHGTVEVFGWEIHLRLTKFMALELVAALLMLLIFIPLARNIATGQRPRGRVWNMFEVVLLFVRDEMVRPAIGRPEADRFLPFIWTLFLFILSCNLLGMLPWAGSPTGSISVTGAMALVSFAVVVGAGMKKSGPLGFWTGLVPHMELPWLLAIPLKPMILFIEIFGLLIKHTILAVRLLANMFAGHLVLAVIMGFILLFVGKIAWYGVMPAAVLGATALSLLELFVAFLQAYIFAFLTALFIGMAVHQH